MHSSKPKFKVSFLILIFILFLPLSILNAQEKFLETDELNQADMDSDGLSDYNEANIYHTNPSLADTDGDGYEDGIEIQNAYDPNKAWDDKIQKIIGISLKNQTLTYSLGPYPLKTIKISSGLTRTPTPKGEFSVIAKKPLVNYRGAGYNYPNTKWNLMFKYGTQGNFYIHGAYWHNNFGKPMSHGCVNVSYQDMEALYGWGEEGTRVTIE